MKSPKKHGDLPPILKETLRLLAINPTTRFVIERTGKDKRNVSKDIKRLINLKLIKRIDRGVYSVLKSPISKQGVTPSHLSPNYFRLHALQIRANISNDDLKRLRNLIIKTPNHKKQPNGIYFKYLVSGLITTTGLHLSYPKDWDVKANTRSELIDLVYDEIMDTLSKWEGRYKIGIFKDNKVNFEITNMHIAICENGIVKEFKNKKISEFVVKDDFDGKPRFIMDFSKGFAELEAIHPNKAFDDVGEAKFFMNTLKDGHYRKNYAKTCDFFDTSESYSLSDINKTLDRLAKKVVEITEKELETKKELNEVVKILSSTTKTLELSINENSRLSNKINLLMDLKLSEKLDCKPKLSDDLSFANYFG